MTSIGLKEKIRVQRAKNTGPELSDPIRGQKRVNVFSQATTKGRRHYSSGQRMYLDQLKKGGYNSYAGGLLFTPFLSQYPSMEDFRRVYPEEFGLLIGRTTSPSHFTLRRFLHKVRKLAKSEELIESFAAMYLKTGLAKWGVLSCLT